MDADPQLQLLDELVARNEADFVPTGIAVNLLNLRPEICALIAFHTPEWSEQHHGNRACCN